MYVPQQNAEGGYELSCMGCMGLSNDAPKKLENRNPKNQGNTGSVM